MGKNVVTRDVVEAAKLYPDMGDIFYSECNGEYYIVASAGEKRGNVAFVLCCLSDGNRWDDSGSLSEITKQLEKLDAVPFYGKLTIEAKREQ